MICRKSSLDTKAITLYIYTVLLFLDKLIVSQSDNIIKFNKHVKTQVRYLNKHSEMTQDLLVSLTKGYMACKDKNFCKYISNLVTRYKDDKYSNLILNVLMVCYIKGNSIYTNNI